VEGRTVFSDGPGTHHASVASEPKEGCPYEQGGRGGIGGEVENH